MLKKNIFIKHMLHIHYVAVAWNVT